MMQSLFLGIGALCFVIGFALSWSGLDRATQRRIYWTAAGIAAGCGFLSGHPNLHTAVASAVLLLAAMTAMAYVSTPYIKIRGTIYALAIADRRPDPTPADDRPARSHDAPNPTTDPIPDSYNGILTPATVWWALAVIAGIAAANTYAYLFNTGQPAPAVVGAGFAALLALAGGYGDASWGYPIARRQYLPFGVATALTAGSFAALYLAAYYAARRFPVRRKESGEYRPHPRHDRPPN